EDGAVPDTGPTLEFHPAANTFDLLDGEEFAGLKADIAANGQQESIVLFDGKILDGRNRYRACRERGIRPKTRTWDGQDDPETFVWSVNFHRRHLTKCQRAAYAVELKRKLSPEAEDRRRRHGGTAPGRKAETHAGEIPGVSGEAREQA